ncbi:uncharacterized protein PGTG_18965 [Puccinia graminis f. sp. tritici CRL 75-36-700-3]|uniref:Uncharacterized protein n=1 Tax=Puccinia graminis f. sp. tritici (strain CRL 75-36-700-3 / race SCCL) TaxID=418459 RepID=E3L8S7_PUCGT|nr:uncharacterized protein PGTG_18965 [Puccinia graminis f. sp. tritici CRL 75-36-700-3]EFP92952.1 hypothetical protein PGTG_18965 [Puccinia graminis f. sp. tritici CRL 75-36-700-3]
MASPAGGLTIMQKKKDKGEMNGLVTTVIKSESSRSTLQACDPILANSKLKLGCSAVQVLQTTRDRPTLDKATIQLLEKKEKKSRQRSATDASGAWLTVYDISHRLRK